MCRACEYSTLAIIDEYFYIARNKRIEFHAPSHLLTLGWAVCLPVCLLACFSACLLAPSSSWLHIISQCTAHTHSLSYTARNGTQCIPAFLLTHPVSISNYPLHSSVSQAKQEIKMQIVACEWSEEAASKGEERKARREERGEAAIAICVPFATLLLFRSFRSFLLSFFSLARINLPALFNVKYIQPVAEPSAD